MKHMNPKVVALLREGYSINTIEKFNTKQVDVLYEKTINSKKETTEATTQNVTSKVTTLGPGEKIAAPQGKETTISNKDGKTIVTTTEGEVTEKAVSKKQQQFFGIVRGMQKGDIPKKGKAGKAAKEMTKQDVEDFASTKHKGLPKKVKSEKSEVKKLEESILKLLENHFNPETTKKELLNYISKRK